MIFPLLGGIKIHLSKDDKAALVNYYTGLYEFEEMCFLLHFQRKQDLFLDAGANIGVFSLLASGHTGCKSVAFEPIPSTYERLKRNISLNRFEQSVTAVNIGLGSENKTLKFTNNLENSINRVAKTEDTNVVDVNVHRLDDFIKDFNGYESILLKVDVEGFETEVLNGADSLLSNPLLKAIIIELNGSGEKFGFDESRIKEKLNSLGFQLLYYQPFTRTLSSVPTQNSWGNAIYIRDLDFVKLRLCNASSISILGKNI
jgi:FkbM family methyltransferase